VLFKNDKQHRDWVDYEKGCVRRLAKLALFDPATWEAQVKLNVVEAKELVAGDTTGYSGQFFFFFWFACLFVVWPLISLFFVLILFVEFVL
jgi:hypothetical protein